MAKNRRVVVLRVRDISNLEGQRLSKVIRRSRDPVEVRRAQVILASAQGFASPKISLIVGMTQDYCRTLIHEFNESGLEMLKPRWRPGVKAKFTEEQKQRLVELATTRPRDIDLPFQQWSLSRLQAEAMRQRIVEYISVEWLRVILDEADVSHQSIKTWKQSTDPLFQEKKRRIDRLTSKKHNPPVVLSIDEIGPISLKPHGGDGWFREAKPDRVRATYNRKGGTRYEYLCLNVFHQQLSVQQEEHKGGAIWLAFLQAERAKYPSDERIYVIQDGLSAHWTPDVRAWARANRVTLVPTATNASWMNPVECHAGDIQKLALDGSDHANWDIVNQAFQRAVTYRNEERKLRGKTFQDTRRKHRRPLWTRH
ncbi:MAG: IS630 family transposase [Gemmatimonadaceae bacterium]